MSPDAELRMTVYQEGQRAFNKGTTCPYTDWRAKTWAKGRAAAEKYEADIQRYIEQSAQYEESDPPEELDPSAAILALTERVEVLERRLDRIADDFR